MHATEGNTAHTRWWRDRTPHFLAACLHALRFVPWARGGGGEGEFGKRENNILSIFLPSFSVPHLHLPLLIRRPRCFPEVYAVRWQWVWKLWLKLGSSSTDLGLMREGKLKQSLVNTCASKTQHHSQKLGTERALFDVNLNQRVLFCLSGYSWRSYIFSYRHDDTVTVECWIVRRTISGLRGNFKARLHMRFLMRFPMRFREQNAPYPTLHECFFREVSRGLGRKLSHIIWRHPSFKFLLAWRDFVAALRD